MAPLSAGLPALPIADDLKDAVSEVLLAEVASGAHFGPHLVVPYREVIRDPDFLARLERVIVFGRPTLSREVPWLIERGGIEAAFRRIVCTNGAATLNAACQPLAIGVAERMNLCLHDFLLSWVRMW